MKKVLHVTMVVIIGLLVLSVAGCSESYAEKKQAMVQNWEKSTVQSKLATVEGLIEQGDLQKAKSILNECLEIEPDSPRIHLLIGSILFAEGHIEQARQSFLSAVENDPELDRGWYFLGSLAVVDKNYPQALDYFNKALALQPSNTDYVISVSSMYVETEQIDKAQQIIEAQLSRHSNDLTLMLELAHIYQQSSDMSSAARTYEQAQLIHGNLPQILEVSAYAYMSMGRWNTAAEKLESLLSHYEQGTEHYNVTLRSLAMASFHAENYGRAIDCYDELSVVYREDSEIWLGMAQAALGLDKPERAVYCARKALQYKPGWSKAQNVLGGAYYVKGDYQESLNSFIQLTGNDDYAAFAWFMTGRCYRQMGRIVDAETAFKRAEELDPDNEMIRTFIKKTVKYL
ncbi:MAG: tetratricopeptide repeat protein [Planctomycetota bacterium]|jgi:tetratricopeptide (TPR) repeat protein